jgi:Zn-dependent protease with chaperone function
MEDYQSTHSVKLAISTAGVLALGMIFLYAMPVLTVRDSGFGETTTEHVKYGDVKPLMGLAGGDWANTFLWIGLIAAIVAAVALPNSHRQLRAVVASAGAIAMMAVPFWLSRHLEGDSLGSGAILAWIAFAIAAIIPWLVGRGEPAGAWQGGNEGYESWNR